ncbi:antitoxin [Microlunatus elymi]|uniref:Antitoxin n=1 Tax=Microlunatus elymi TaxID=2596828 RepID=A0A516Q3K5_9ACTN|nr:antitoxin [Microlunatus elymi]QDP98017.1 antitoxin [Microlunatus elymi]
MKTTLDLPDDLMRTVKVRAAQEDRRLKDVIADLLRRGLAAESAPRQGAAQRVQFPIIAGGHPAKPEEEVTPERVAELLLNDEVDSVGK